jgi:hypothetical protein
VDSFSRGDEARRTLDAAHQMGHMLTDNAGVAAAAGADTGCLAQQVNGLAELLVIDVCDHFVNAFTLNYISVTNGF